MFVLGKHNICPNAFCVWILKIQTSSLLYKFKNHLLSEGEYLLELQTLKLLLSLDMSLPHLVFQLFFLHANILKTAQNVYIQTFLFIFLYSVDD